MMHHVVPSSSGWTQTLDIQVLFFRLTLDSATEFLFGESLNSQTAAVKRSESLQAEEKGFMHAFDRSQWYLTKAGFYGEFWWMAHNAEFRALCGQVHQFVDRFVQLALSIDRNEKFQETKGLNSGVKERYVFLEALATQTQDPIELRNQLLNILLARRDTTASLLSWVFMLLAHHPAVFKKLRQEVINHLCTYSSPQNLTFAKLKNCRYLQGCLNETLRLYPVVPLNGRQAVRDTSIPFGGGRDGNSPVFIPKGHIVSYSVRLSDRCNKTSN
jgi:cytochrome P450